MKKLLSRIATISAFLVIGLLMSRPVHAQNFADRTRCIQGYVWRGAVANDFVCVTPQAWAQAAADNWLDFWNKVFGGAYGPDTCSSGYVWREITNVDHVCVTPETRAQVADDTAQAAIRIAYKGDRLPGGSGLQQHSTEFLSSHNRNYILIMQEDCNLVLYNLNHQALWTSATEGQGSGCHAEMQPDGNFVLYNGDGGVLWATGTKGNPGAFIGVQDDGNVVIDLNGSALWATNTEPETLNDRCSGDVFIARQYKSYPPSSGIANGVFLTRAGKSETEWSNPIVVDDRQIRWWCNSTTGNWADPGTWRVIEGYIAVGCDTDLTTEVSNCHGSNPTVSLASSAVGGWTPERAACTFPPRAIRARLGRDRLLQIECLR